jgi:hypothetical protein
MKKEIMELKLLSQKRQSEAEDTITNLKLQLSNQ